MPVVTPTTPTSEPGADRLKCGPLTPRDLATAGVAATLAASAVVATANATRRSPTRAAASAGREFLPGMAIDPRIIETAVGPVEYDITSGSGPVVLASHGGIGGVDQARLMLAWLDPSRYRLLSVSRPGYLGTPLQSGETMDAQADLFAALLDALRIDRAAVVTFSSGGPPGYLLALRHPRRVSALVAISSVSGYYESANDPNAITRAIFMSTAGQALTQFVARHKPAWLLREMLASVGDYNDTELREHVEYVLRSPEALAFVRAFLATMSPYGPRRPGTDNDTQQLRQLTHLPLRDVRCPALIVHGTCDSDVPMSDGEYAVARIPGAQSLSIDGGSHLAFWLSSLASVVQTTARAFLDEATSIPAP